MQNIVQKLPKIDKKFPKIESLPQLLYFPHYVQNVPLIDGGEAQEAELNVNNNLLA